MFRLRGQAPCEETMKKLAIFVLLFLPSFANAGNYAFCVGVNGYAVRKGKPDQYGPDASALDHLFKTHGFHATKLIGQQATHDNVIKQFRHLADICHPNDTVFVFFSNHGGTGKKGKFGIVLADRELKGLELAEFINNIKARVIVVLDTCDAAGIFNYELRHDSCILCASRVHEASYGGQRKPLYGFFASAVFNALKGRADYNHNGTVDVQELCRYVSNPGNVQGSTKQHAVVKNGLGTIPLVKVGHSIKRPNRQVRKP